MEEHYRVIPVAMSGRCELYNVHSALLCASPEAQHPSSIVASSKWVSREHHVHPARRPHTELLCDARSTERMRTTKDIELNCKKTICKTSTLAGVCGRLLFIGWLHWGSIHCSTIPVHLSFPNKGGGGGHERERAAFYNTFASSDCQHTIIIVLERNNRTP